MSVSPQRRSIMWDLPSLRLLRRNSDLVVLSFIGRGVGDVSETTPFHVVSVVGRSEQLNDPLLLGTTG